MSKKLIAAAAAAALALTALVGVAPASATTTISGGSGDNGLSEATAKEITVPEDNQIDAEDRVTFVVSSAVNRTVSATATGGVKLMTETAQADGTDFPASAGTQSLAVNTGVSTSITFYAFTTSTAVGTVVVNDGVGNTQTFFVKGTSDTPYNISVVAPTSIATSGDGSLLSVNVTDVFGNALETLGGAELKITTLGGGSSIYDTEATPAEIADGLRTAVEGYNSTTKAFEVYIRASTGGGVAITAELRKVAAADAGPDAITGLPKPVSTFFASINAADLSAQVTALTAQVAALQVIVDRKVTKKRYNTLARKWNRAFPSQKVWVKP